MKPKRAFLHINPGLLIILGLSLSPVSARDVKVVKLQAEPTVHIVPTYKAVRPGETISMDCIHYPENLEENALIEWYLPGWDIPLSSALQNQSIINQMSSDILRFSVENNTLTIENITMADAGVYTCKNRNGTLKAEAYIKVQVMPTYFTEGMVVLGINIGLIIVSIGCCVWHRCSERRRLAKNNMSKIEYIYVVKQMHRK